MNYWAASYSTKNEIYKQYVGSFHPYINIGFANNAFRKTEISAAFSLNYDKSLLGIYPNLSVDYNKLILSVCKLPMIEAITVELIDPENVKLTWS